MSGPTPPVAVVGALLWLALDLFRGLRTRGGRGAAVLNLCGHAHTHISEHVFVSERLVFSYLVFHSKVIIKSSRALHGSNVWVDAPT